MSKLNLLLVDDHEILVDGLSTCFQQEPNLVVSGKAHSGEQVLNFLRKNYNEIDIVVMDVNIPDINGIKLTEIINKKYPDLKVLIFSMHAQPEIVRSILALGASGYVLKTSSKTELIKAIAVVASGQQYLCGEILKLQKELEKAEQTLHSKTGKKCVLTEREKEIIRLIATGFNTKEIASKLHISVHTVNTHRKKIGFKTRTRNTAEITLYAFETGLIKRFDLR